MADDGYVWGEASVSYPDWQGTMQVDERKTIPWDLYDYTKIDADNWTIIGLDWGAAESGVLSMDAIVVPVNSNGDREVLATSIRLHDVDPFDLLVRMAHVADFRLRVREVVSHEIRIINHLDIPEQ